MMVRCLRTSSSAQSSPIGIRLIQIQGLVRPKYCSVAQSETSCLFCLASSVNSRGGGWLREKALRLLYCRGKQLPGLAVGATVLIQNQWGMPKMSKRWERSEVALEVGEYDQ